MLRSLFNEYERKQQDPILFKWVPHFEPIFVPSEEYLYAGELITVEKFNETQRNGYYVLTLKKLIELNDVEFKNPVNATFVLNLRHPRVIKVSKPELGL